MLGRFLTFILLAMALLGCATTNVRAIRAYAYEDPDFVIALDRIDDIAEVLRLLDVVMTEIPYSPGDKWIDELALSDEKAEKMKENIRKLPPYDNPEFTIPIVKLYRYHLADVVRTPNPPSAKATKAPTTTRCSMRSKI